MSFFLHLFGNFSSLSFNEKTCVAISNESFEKGQQQPFGWSNEFEVGYFFTQKRMFDASFRPRAWCVWFRCNWCGVVLLVGQDSVYEREDMWGERAKERTLGRGCFQAAFNCAPQAPLPRQGKPTTHCSLVAAAQTFCLDGWRDRGGANHYCCFNWCIAILPHFYSPLILYLRPSHPSGRTFHLNISSFLLFLWELSLLFLLYDKIKVREWDNLSLASKASLEIFTRWE